MMAASEIKEWQGELRYNESMSQHTTWRVGGPAQRFYRPLNIEDLSLFLRVQSEDEPLIWLGLGSNVLVRDGGILGTVIATKAMLGGLDRINDHTLRAEVGVTCAKVARYCSKTDTTGLEFLAGIPGNIGGALAMNAGAFGSETWPQVLAVETIDRAGEVRLRDKAEFKIGYRSVHGPQGEWFVAAHFRLQADPDGASRQRIKALLDRRGKTQPIGLPSCGSVFRNPEGGHAAALIERAGLKGMRIGGACVSEKHANFIINSGDSTAADIESLILKVRQVVEEKYGIQLIPEVRIIGETNRVPSRLSDGKGM